MRLDRIFLDIIEWVRSQLLKKKSYPKYSPVVLSQKSSPRGIIQRIERDTHRSLSTWRFMPHRGTNANPDKLDILLCLDDLSAGEWGRGKTHKLSILKVSHWIGIEGDFEAEELYTQNCDFSGPGVDPHRWGRAILQNLAITLLRKEITDWPWEVKATTAVYLKGKEP